MNSAYQHKRKKVSKMLPQTLGRNTLKTESQSYSIKEEGR